MKARHALLGWLVCASAALGGGIARLSHAVFEDRTRPNCLGMHIYDEALLTEVKDPTTMPHGPASGRVPHG